MAKFLTCTCIELNWPRVPINRPADVHALIRLREVPVINDVSRWWCPGGWYRHLCRWAWCSVHAHWITRRTATTNVVLAGEMSDWTGTLLYQYYYFVVRLGVPSGLRLGTHWHQISHRKVEVFISFSESQDHLGSCATYRKEISPQYRF